jgi:hypothetical protein
MASHTFKITDGPNKPTLQRALMMPEELTARFDIEGEGLDVAISKMEELPDGFSFELEGTVASGSMKSAPFRAIYSIEGRTGSIAVDQAPAS